MASDLAIVSGRTGCTSSTPSANAVATGEQPVACAPETRTSRCLVEQADLVQLLEALVDLREQRAARDRHDHVVGRLPAELLGGLVRERLRALGVERPHVDVHERPRVLGRELRAQAVDVVVVAVDGDDVAAVDRGGEDLPGLEVGRDEHEAGQAGARGRGAATALARLPVDAHAAVLKPNSSALPSATATTRSLNEFVGLRVSSLSHSSPRPSSAARRSARISGVQPAASAFARRRLHREQGRVAPDRRRPGRDRLPRDRRRDRVVVVGGLERAEAPLAGVDRGDWDIRAHIRDNATRYQ